MGCRRLTERRDAIDEEKEVVSAKWFCSSMIMQTDRDGDLSDMRCISWASPIQRPLGAEMDTLLLHAIKEGNPIVAF